MDSITWQVTGYEDAAGVPQVGQIVLIRTSDEVSLVSFPPNC